MLFRIKIHPSLYCLICQQCLEEHNKAALEFVIFNQRAKGENDNEKV